MKPLVRTFVVAVMSLCALLTLVVDLAQTEAVREFARVQVLAAINDGIAGELEVGRIEGTVVTRLGLVDVKVRTPEGEVAMAARRVDAEVELLPLLTARVLIQAARVDGLDFLVTDAAGRVPIARAFAPRVPSPDPDEPSPWVIDIRTLQVVDSAVEARDGADRRGATDLHVSGRLRQGPDGLTWQDLRVLGRLQGLPVPSLEVASSGSLSSDGLTLAPLEVRAGPHVVVARGSLRGLDATPVVDLTLETAHVDLPSLVRRMPELGVMHGAVDVSGKLQGTVADATVDLRVETVGGTLEIAGQAGLRDGFPHADLVLDGRRLSPASVRPDLGVPLAGTVAGRVQVDGDPRLGGDADIRLAVTGLGGLAGVPERLEMSARAAAGRGAVSVEARGLQASLRGPIAGPWDARASLVGLDVGALLSAVGVGGIEGRVEALTASGEITPRDEGAPAVSADVAAALADVGIDRGGEPLAGRHLAARAGLTWDGAGLPAGTLYVDGQGLSVGDRDLGELSVELSASDVGDGALQVRGQLAGERLVLPREGVALARFDIPLDVRVSAADWRPRGTVAARLDRVAAPGLDAARLRVDVRVQPAPAGRLEVVGNYRVSDLDVSGAVGAGEARGEVDLVVGDGLRGDVTASGERFRVAGLTSRQVEAKVSLAPAPGGLRLEGGARLDGLVVNRDVEAGRLAVSDVSLLLGGGVPRGRLAFVAERLRAWERVHPRLAGKVELTGDGDVLIEAAGGVLQRAEVAIGLPRGRRRGTEVTVRWLRLQEGRHGFVIRDSTLALTPGRISSPRFAIEELGGAGTLSFRGAIQTGGQPLRASVEARSVDLVRWPERLRHLTGAPIPPLPVTGVVDATVQLAGSGANPRLDYKIALNGGAFWVVDAVTARFEGRLDSGRLRLEGQAGWGDDASLAVDVRMPLKVTLGPFGVKPPDLELARGSVKLRNVSLARFEEVLPPIDGKPPTGTIGLDLSLEGTARDRLRLVGALRGRKLALGRMAPRDVDVAVRLDPNSTQITRLALARHDVLRKTVTRELDASLNLRVGLLQAAIEVAKGEAPPKRLLDTLRSFPQAQSLATLDVPGLRLGELPGIPTRYSDITLATTQAFVIGGRLSDPTAEGRLTIEQIPIAETLGGLTLQLGGGPPRFLVSAAGAVLTEGELSLPNVAEHLINGGGVSAILQDPKLALRFELPAMSSDYLGDIAYQLGREVDQLMPGGRLGLSVAITGAPGGPRASVRGSLTRRFASEAPGLARGVELMLDVSASEARLMALVDQGAAGGALGVRAQLAGGSAALLDPPEDLVEWVMTRPLSGRIWTSGEAAATASRAFALERLARVMPAVFSSSQGVLEAGVELGGTPREPSLTGAIDLRFDEVTFAALGLHREDFALRLKFSPGSEVAEGRLDVCAGPPRGTPATAPCAPVVIEEADGRLELAVAMALGSINPAALMIQGRLVLEKFRLFRKPDLKGRVDADLELGGTALEPAVEGDIKLLSALIEPDLGGSDLQEVGLPKDVRFKREGAAARRGADGEEASLAASRPMALDVSGMPVDLDVAVTIPKRRARVRNPFVDAWPHGKLQVTTERRMLTMRGRIEVDDGKVELYGQRFVFAEDSYVAFTGRPRRDPEVHIRATYDISDVDLSAIGQETGEGSKVTVAIDGDMAQLGEPELSSDPPMDKSQILSVIVFGTPSAGGGADSDQVNAHLSKVLLGFLGLNRGLEGAASRLVDTLSFSATAETLRLQVGKKLGKDLWGYYKLNLGAAEDENTHEVRVEWRLGGRLRVEGRYGDAGEGSFDVIYRIRD